MRSIPLRRSMPTPKFKTRRAKPGNGKGSRRRKADNKENAQSNGNDNVELMNDEETKASAEEPVSSPAEKAKEMPVVPDTGSASMSDDHSPAKATDQVLSSQEEAQSSGQTPSCVAEQVEKVEEGGQVLAEDCRAADAAEQKSCGSKTVVRQGRADQSSTGGSPAKKPPLYNDREARTPAMASHWHWSHRIGLGRVACVKRAAPPPGDTNAMLKVRGIEVEHNVCYAAVREVALLMGVQHPNIQTLVDVFFEDTNTNIVREWAGTDLATFMQTLASDDLPVASRLRWSGEKPAGAGFCVDRVRELSQQLFSGLEFCHARGMMCRDIRPPNLFLDEACEPPRLRISGFALSRSFSLPMQKYSPQVREIGHTVAYLSPEQLLGVDHYTPAVDVWAAGCVVAEMLSGAPLFKSEDNTQISTIFAIFHMLGTPSAQTWPELEDAPEFKVSFPQWTRCEWESIHGIGQQIGQEGCTFLDGLLQMNPRERLSARLAGQHRWLAGDGGLLKMKQVSVLEILSKTSFLPSDAMRLISGYLHAFPDVRMLPEYASDIIAHWMKQERPIPNYMHEQVAINSKMRAILLDWLVEVNTKYKLRDETLFLTAALIDLFCAGRHIQRSRFQLVGVVAMLIASKLEECFPPSVSDFVTICDNCYDRHDVEHLENVMLHELRDHLGTPTSMNFLRSFMKANRSSTLQQHFAIYCATYAQVHSSMPYCKHKPSQLAAAAVMASNVVTNQLPIWQASMEAHTGYSESELRTCVRDLLQLFKTALHNTDPHQAVQNLFGKRLSGQDKISWALLETDFVRLFSHTLEVQLA